MPNLHNNCLFFFLKSSQEVTNLNNIIILENAVRNYEETMEQFIENNRPYVGEFNFRRIHFNAKYEAEHLFISEAEISEYFNEEMKLAQLRILEYKINNKYTYLGEKNYNNRVKLEVSTSYYILYRIQSL